VFADALRHLVLPASILSVISLAMITRVTRAAMLDILHEDYLRTARAKGLSEPRIVLKHGLRNASVPIVTVIGIQLGQLIGGVVVTETIFSWPGLGLYAVTAVENQDYPAILAFTLLATVVYVVINLAVDALYPLLDPRTRG
jgi:peptide/nickel transport system permease protein